MTEAEWLAGDNSRLMLRFLGTRMSSRKFRIFMCCWLREEDWPDAESAAVEVAERNADGLASEEERGRAGEAADRAVQRWYGHMGDDELTNYLRALWGFAFERTKIL